MSKLRRIHIIIIGVVVCLLVGAGLYFLVVDKAVKARDAALVERDGVLGAGGTEANCNDKFKELQDANLKVLEATAKYEKTMRARMPNISLDDTRTGMLALWHEQSEVLGPLLLNHIRSSKGIHLLSSIQIPNPTANPNDLQNFADSPIRIDIGKVSVSGDFKSIMNHLRSWSKLNRLVLIDQPSLTGESPNLVCEYTLSVFLYPMTPPGPPIDIAPPANSSGGTGGMGGGMPSGGLATVNTGQSTGGSPVTAQPLH
ncbi:MAG: hypothetical protein ABFD64_08525 [Armatimonadota bacterium]